MSHSLESRQASTAVHEAGPAPATLLTNVTRNSGRVAIVFRPAERMHIGGALLLTAPLARLAADRFPRSVVLMDYGFGGNRPGAAGLTDAALDRLACLPDSNHNDMAVASRVPSIARLAAVVASHVPGGQNSRTWFSDILLAAGLLSTRSTHAIIEAGGTDDFALSRRLVACLEKVTPGVCQNPLPALPGMQPLRSLDGVGAMGSSSRGTLFVTDSPDQILRKVRSARTDTRPALDPEQAMSPEVCNLLLLLHELGGESIGALLNRYTGHGYARLKDDLAAAACAFLAPIQRRREQLLGDAGALTDAVTTGSLRLEASAALLADTFTYQPELLVA